MVLSAENRILIKLLRQEKGYDAKMFIVEFPNKPWTRSGLKKLLRKMDTDGCLILGTSRFSVNRLTEMWLFVCKLVVALLVSNLVKVM